MSSRQKVVSEVRSINKTIARRMLADSPMNRPIIAESVVRMAAAMLRPGDWTVADPIILDEENRLLDGHHRLHGVVEADVSVRFLVISGVKREDYWGRGNQGRPRTAGHALAEQKVHNWSCVAATASRVLCWEAGVRPPVPGRTRAQHRASSYQIALRALDDPQLIQVVNETPRCRGLMTPGTRGFLSWLFSQTDATHAKCFFTDLSSGEGLPAKDPVLVLRNKIIQTRLDAHRKRQRMDEGLLMAWTIRAWNASVANKPLTMGSLRWTRGTEFPEPIDPR